MCWMDVVSLGVRVLLVLSDNIYLCFVCCRVKFFCCMWFLNGFLINWIIGYEVVIFLVVLVEKELMIKILFVMGRSDLMYCWMFCFLLKVMIVVESLIMG